MSEMFCSPPLSDAFNAEELERARNIPDEVIVADIRANRQHNAEHREAYDRMTVAYSKMPQAIERGYELYVFNVCTRKREVPNASYVSIRREAFDRTLAALRAMAAKAEAPLLVRFQFDDDLRIIRPAYYIDDAIPLSAEIAFIGGQSGAGKTFIAVHLGVCLASGLPFFGRTIERRTCPADIRRRGYMPLSTWPRISPPLWSAE
jgi:AAA domain